MPDIIINRCCSVLPEGKTKDGLCFIRCPICGNETYAFPMGVLEASSSPNEKICPPEIAEDAAKRWDESLLAKRRK